MRQRQVVRVHCCPRRQQHRYMRRALHLELARAAENGHESRTHSGEGTNAPCIFMLNGRSGHAIRHGHTLTTTSRSTVPATPGAASDSADMPSPATALPSSADGAHSAPVAAGSASSRGDVTTAHQLQSALRGHARHKVDVRDWHAGSVPQAGCITNCDAP